MYDGPAFSAIKLPSPVNIMKGIHHSATAGFTRTRGLPEWLTWEYASFSSVS